VAEVFPLANGHGFTAAELLRQLSCDLYGQELVSFAGILNGSCLLNGLDSVAIVLWLALLLAPYLREGNGKLPFLTYVGDRYYSNKARVVAVHLCGFLISFTYRFCRGQMPWGGIGSSQDTWKFYLSECGVVIGMCIVFLLCKFWAG